MKRKVLTYFLCLSMAVTSVPSLGLIVHAEDAAIETESMEGTMTGAEPTEDGTVDSTVTEEDVVGEADSTTEGETTAGAGSDTPAGVADAGSDEAAGMAGTGVAEDITIENNAIATVADNTGEKWYAKVEAENGTLGEGVITEDPGNVPGNAVIVKNLDGGRVKGKKFSITVDAPFDGEANMKVAFRANPGRDLCYEINGDGNGTTGVMESLDSGNWNTIIESKEESVTLKTGENTIEFFAKDDQLAPDVDYITFSWNGGTAEDMKPDLNKITVEFKIGDQVVKTLNPEELSDATISKEQLPTKEEMEAVATIAGTAEEQDFLGWFWGPRNKYEGTFPMKLQDAIDHEGIERKNELILEARYGKHVDGYSVETVENHGQRLIFEDDFDGEGLDSAKWVDKYLSSWSKDWQRTQSYEFHPEDEENNGSMSLVINETTEPWCPEFDSKTVISGFTTGDRNGLHNWKSGTNQVRNPHDTELTHINQYGYYEMRMKGQPGSARHSAWWLLGFEDIPEESAEIDIFEILGRDEGQNTVALHAWNDKDAFGGATKTNAGKLDSDKELHSEWHVYGLNWVEGGGDAEAGVPDRLDSYIDGELYGSANVNIDYPMIQLVSQYEKRYSDWTGDWEWQPYPNSMEIDYVRVYKDVPEGKAQENPTIEEIKVEDVEIAQKDIALKTYPGEGGGENGGDYTEKYLPGTKSYVRVEWSDGVQTQEPVTWDAITPEDIKTLKTGTPIKKAGTVTITSDPDRGVYTYDGGDVTMTITPEAVPPWDITGAQLEAGYDLGLLFDGKINEEGAGSAQFIASEDDMANGNVAITYDFRKNVLLSGIDMWTNYGESQGIHDFEIAVWDEESGDWTTLKGEDGQNQMFEAKWTTAAQPAEEFEVTFSPVSTSKVKIIIKSAGLQWKHIAMREIEFHTEDIVLGGIKVTPPTKTTYIEGEALDTAGMVITGTYSDDTEKEIPVDSEGVEISGYDPAKVGTQTITVTYQEKTATFDVVVAANNAPVIKGAKDVTLFVGQMFDPRAGVTATDKEDDDLTDAIEITSDVNTDQAGEYTVTYKVTDKNGKSATTTIKVTVKAIILESIKVTTEPTKTTYVEGEALDTAGMVITGTYSDGTEKEIPVDSEEVEISGYNPAKVGAQTITVTYQEKTATFTVEVKKKALVINKIPTISGAKDVVLTVGDKFDPLKGITAKDAEDGDLTKAIVVKSNVDTTKAGKYEVVYTVTDSEGAAVTKTIKVTVKAKAVKPGDGDSGNNNDDNQNDNNQNNNVDDKDKAVQTGDTLNVGFWALLMMASVAAVSLFFRRKSKK